MIFILTLLWPIQLVRDLILSCFLWLEFHWKKELQRFICVSTLGGKSFEVDLLIEEISKSCISKNVTKDWNFISFLIKVQSNFARTMNFYNTWRYCWIASLYSTWNHTYWSESASTPGNCPRAMKLMKYQNNQLVSYGFGVNLTYSFMIDT